MARTIRFKVYKFNELSKEAKSKAIEWARQGLYEFGYNWADEWHDTVKEFCEEFNVKYRSSYFSSYNSNIDYSLSHIDDDKLNISGKRLMAYLWNHYDHLIIQRKTKYFVRRDDGTKMFNAVGHNSGKYISKCEYERASCPMTGVCYDDDMLNPIYDFVHGKTFRKNTTLEDIIRDCIRAAEKSADNDCQGQESDEYLSDHIIANEYEFNKDGSKF